MIGVLFAADRQRREFTAEEVALLSSLAAHAAIAIDNAQLLDETRQANETISGHNERMRRAEPAFAAWVDQNTYAPKTPGYVAATISLQ